MDGTPSPLPARLRQKPVERPICSSHFNNGASLAAISSTPEPSLPHLKNTHNTQPFSMGPIISSGCATAARSMNGSRKKKKGRTISLNCWQLMPSRLGTNRNNQTPACGSKGTHNEPSQTQADHRIGSRLPRRICLGGRTVLRF